METKPERVFLVYFRAKKANEPTVDGYNFITTTKGKTVEMVDKFISIIKKRDGYDHIVPKNIIEMENSDV